MKKILISTGGSGGHVIPAVSLIDHFKENFEVYLLTDKRGSKFIDKNFYSYEIIDTPQITFNIIKFPLFLILFTISFFKSLKILREKKINYLFSTGGYMSMPFCLAAKILNIDIFLFEPNMVIGRSNKFFLRFSKKILCYSDQIKNFPNIYKKKIFLINSLLRKKIYSFKKKQLNEISNPIRILVLGGSQGAKFFDEKIKDLIFETSQSIKIYLIQQVHDKTKEQELKNFYKKIKLEHEIFGFDENLYKKFNTIDLAITRSGSTALSELSFYNVPFIAVPFPHAKDDHQFFNAKYFYDKNCCWLFTQNEFDVKIIKDFIINLFKDKKEYFEKKDNLNKFSYQNNWNDINKKLLELINEY